MRNRALALAVFQAILVADVGNTQSPLYRATERGDVEEVRELLDDRHNPYSKDVLGYTPWAIACYLGDVEIVTQYLLHGVSIEATSNGGQTCLHHAASKNRKKLASLLVRIGADLNAETTQGSTPVNIARNSGHFELAQYLKSRGGAVGSPVSFGAMFNLLTAYGMVKGVSALGRSVLEAGEDHGPTGAVTIRMESSDVLPGSYTLRFEPRNSAAIQWGVLDEKVVFEETDAFWAGTYGAEVQMDSFPQNSIWEVHIFGAGGSDSSRKLFDLDVGSCGHEVFFARIGTPIKSESCLGGN